MADPPEAAMTAMATIQEGTVAEVSPWAICFSQQSISSRFQSGTYLDDPSSTHPEERSLRAQRQTCMHVNLLMKIALH